jgi:hypothetical protein
MLTLIERLSIRQFGLLIVALYFGASLPLLTSWPVLWPDEDVLADIARTFAEHGYFGTTLIKGMEHHVYWLPPFHSILLAGVITIAGFDIVALRLFSILVGLGILWATYRIAAKTNENVLVPRLAVLFLAANPLFVNYVKLVRMDGVCVLLSLCAIAMMLRQGKEGRHWLAGIFIALACLTHPLGYINVAAFGLLLIWERGERTPSALVGLLTPLVVGLALWVTYIFRDPPSFYLQMNLQFERKIFDIGLSTIGFIKSFWIMPTWLMATAAGTVVAIQELRARRSAIELLLSLYLIISLLAVTVLYEFSYHLYVLPFAAFMAARLLNRWHHDVKKKRFAGLFTGAVVANCLLYFIVVNVVVHGKLRNDTDHNKLALQVALYLPDDSTVMIDGYPSVFWGLQKSPKQFRLIRPVFLNEARRIKALSEVKYIVFARGHYPEDDIPYIQEKVLSFSEILSKERKTIRPIASVGSKERYAYSADIFEIVSLDSTSR